MKKLHLKFIALFSMLGLILMFLFCFNVANVNAQELPQGEDEQQEVTEQPEQPEEQEEIKDEEVKKVADLFIDRLSTLSWQDAEAIFGWIISYFVLNIGVIASFAIAFLIKKTKEVKQSEIYKNAVAQLNAEQQKQLEEIVGKFENQLADLKAQLEEKEQQHALELKAAQNENTKEISHALNKVINTLNEE